MSDPDCRGRLCSLQTSCDPLDPQPFCHFSFPRVEATERYLASFILDEEESILPFLYSTLRLTKGGGNDILPSFPVIRRELC
jgi:hypothetical protein